MKRSDLDHASPSFKALNPHLFGSVGGLETNQPEPKAGAALEQNLPGPQGVPVGAGSGAGHERRFRVLFTAHLKRKQDDDNLEAGLKPLRDQIAELIGIDDGDERIEWKYSQLKDEIEGVCVKITEL